MKDLTKFILESTTNPVEDLPNIKTLGEGEFDGILWGHCFLYEGNKYYSNSGWLNMFPMYCKAIINEDNVQLQQIDQYQYFSLKKLFD